MILVEIYIPSVNQQHDYRLDENAFVADILDEIGRQMMEEGISIEQTEDLLLCSCDQARLLPLDHTLRQSGIRDGCRLMML